MGENRGRQAALRDRTGGPAAHGAGGLVGDLALAGGRKDPQLHDRHDGAERIVRRALHNRMPVVLKPRAWPQWLGEQPADVPQLKALLAPYPSDELICWPVSGASATSRTTTRA